MSIELAFKGKVDLDPEHTYFSLSPGFSNDDKRLSDGDLIDPSILVCYHGHDPNKASVLLTYTDCYVPFYSFELSPEEIERVFSILKTKELYPHVEEKKKERKTESRKKRSSR